MKKVKKPKPLIKLTKSQYTALKGELDGLMVAAALALSFSPRIGNDPEMDKIFTEKVDRHKKIVTALAEIGINIDGHLAR